MAQIVRRRRFFGAVRNFLKDESGVAAVEFALFGPLLVFGLLAMADVGMAVYQRMSIDHILRSGAHHAIEDPGASTVKNVLESIAAAEVLGMWGEGEITFDVQRFCACAEQPETEVNCATSCANSKPTSIYYSMRSDLIVPGLILPQFHLQPAMRVQIR